MRKHSNHEAKGIKKFVLLASPYFLIFFAVWLIFFGALRLVADSPVIDAFLNPLENDQTSSADSSSADNSSTQTTTEVEQFPSIAYGTQWATLNVEGWTKNTDIPVYFGDENYLLSKGAGMWIGSRFCGQNGKIVLSAHVTTDFYELEDTPVGALVTVNTTYGDYTYKVREVKVFESNQSDLIKPEDGKEVLFMYTCYPRSVGVNYTSKRCALICDRVEGKVWPQYE